MKTLLRIFFLSLAFNSNCFALESSSLITAIENQNIEAISCFFDHATPISIIEAKKIIAEITCHFSQRFNNLKFIPMNSDVLAHFENQREGTEEIDYPPSMIFGTMELIIGGLIYLLPIPGAKFAGGFLITDGVSRMIDGGVGFDEYTASKLTEVMTILNPVTIFDRVAKPPVMITRPFHPLPYFLGR